MPQFICPVGTCQTENELHADVCVRCGIPLQGYKRLKFYPSHLFNTGLAKARDGQFRQARDFFAAVVLWYPMDVEARNALAMACFAQGDNNEAYQQWSIVLQQIPTNFTALHGLETLAKAQHDSPAEKTEGQIKTLPANQVQQKKKSSVMKNGRKKKIISLYTLIGWG